MFTRFQKKLKSLIQSSVAGEVRKENERILMATGTLLCNLQKSRYAENKKLSEYEFRIFSQWGEDGIIQYLINNVHINQPFFIEFGVENYIESNTRFLLTNNNWSGLVIDSSGKNIEYIKGSDLYWRHNLKAKTGFITAENINELIKEEGIQGEIGLLSIDIDGNDYWVWKAITIVEPSIVIVEYNSVFGKDRYVTVPYNKDFNRHSQHFSGLYWGASLGAFIHLAQERGYLFAGSNSAGNNAFFIKKDRSGSIVPLTLEEGYVESKFRDSRNEKGTQSFKSGKDRFELVRGLPVYDVVEKKNVSL